MISNDWHAINREEIKSQKKCYKICLGKKFLNDYADGRQACKNETVYEKNLKELLISASRVIII